MPTDFNEVKNNIIEYQFLEKGWDSYDSEPISLNSISDALEVLNYVDYYISLAPISHEYSIYTAPMSDGGIQLDIEVMNGKSLSLDINGLREIYIEYLFDDNDTTEEGTIDHVEELDSLLEQVFF